MQDALILTGIATLTVLATGLGAIPVMLLARLAIDKREQGRGLGRALLKDALRRTSQAAAIAAYEAAASAEAQAAWLSHRPPARAVARPRRVPVVAEALAYAPGIEWIAWCPALGDETGRELVDAARGSRRSSFKVAPTTTARGPSEPIMSDGRSRPVTPLTVR